MIEKILKEKLSSICQTKKEEIKNSKLEIVGVDDFKNMNLSDIDIDINKRRFKR